MHPGLSFSTIPGKILDIALAADRDVQIEDDLPGNFNESGTRFFVQPQEGGNRILLFAGDEVWIEFI